MLTGQSYEVGLRGVGNGQGEGAKTKGMHAAGRPSQGPAPLTEVRCAGLSLGQLTQGLPR